MRLDKWSLLAGLRFLLASIVAIGHIANFLPGSGSLPRVAAASSFEAVLGFLVISGFSIGSSYGRGSDGFLKRRVARIYPIYASCLLIAICSYFVLQRHWPSPLVVLANLVLANQIVTTESFIPPMWSLALEFWCYLLTPFLFVLSDRHLKTFIIASATAFLLFTVGRTGLHWSYFAGVGYGLNLLLLGWAWVSGLRLAIVKRDSGWIALIFVAHLLLDAAIQLAYRVKHHESFLADLPEFAWRGVVLALVVASMNYVMHWRPDARISPTLRRLGDISFPLFAVHYPIYAMLTHHGWTNGFLLYGVSVAAAFFMFHGLDRYTRKREKPRLAEAAREARQDAIQRNLALGPPLTPSGRRTA